MLSVNTLDKLSRTGEIIFLFFLKSLILSTMCKVTENSKGTVWNAIIRRCEKFSKVQGKGV